MNDVDQELTEAHRALSGAFFAAFAEVNPVALTSGERLPFDAHETFSVDVSRPDIRDKEWGQHLPAFADAGRKAGRMTKMVSLLPPDQSSAFTFDTNMLRWQVLVGT